MKLVSSRGLEVELPDAVGQSMEKSAILNIAGRVLKHRRILARHRDQLITDEQKSQVERLAGIFAEEESVDNALFDADYGSLVYRRNKGAYVPQNWMSRAIEEVSDNITPVPINDWHRKEAMMELGFLTEEDKEWSEQITKGCENWIISAPDDWGKPK